MSKPYQDSTFSTNETAADPLEALARQGARQMLQAALEAEVAEHLQRQRYERGEAARALLANTLFFANDQQLVQAVFDSALHFVEQVSVSKLTFVPDARVWEFLP